MPFLLLGALVAIVASAIVPIALTHLNATRAQRYRRHFIPTGPFPWPTLEHKGRLCRPRARTVRATETAMQPPTYQLREIYWRLVTWAPSPTVPQAVSGRHHCRETVSNTLASAWLAQDLDTPTCPTWDEEDSALSIADDSTTTMDRGQDDWSCTTTGFDADFFHINPATGLPMLDGCIDIAGNLFGCDSSLWSHDSTSVGGIDTGHSHWPSDSFDAWSS